ncbi:pentatricopeptide repeat-containing protein At3g29230-like [Phalaenopsis equestris]|uniref:pentatricopeptide repeat-containing protein At3g29230-like n=1 Tax=Phalaenopsis equestris TaxID=78828 RepID=UPI0009E19FE0|nr:pentatricopeptide repeat-containing protein At3g29230-like [Phalaenopsis equestris]
MTSPLRPPQFKSHRRLLEQKLSDLHKCSDPNSLVQIHSQIFRLCIHRDPIVVSKLISAYSLCRLPFSFSTFSRMQVSAIKADSFTYSFLLRSFHGHLRRVEVIHSHVFRLGFSGDVFVHNSLICSYSRAGELALARKVFDETVLRDVVSWNSMVGALVRAGEIGDARKVFEEMPERNIVSWNRLLDGYVKVGDMDTALDLFQRIPDKNVVSWSTIVLGYCKKGDMETAKMLFDKMGLRNLVTWTIMISGYAEKGLAVEASTLLNKMEEAGFELDPSATISILAACAESGLLGLGKRIHASVKRFTTQISNALIDMYSKCGDSDEAWIIFEETIVKDLMSWNSMIHGLAMHGHGERALDLFARMEGEDFMPDGITFIGVLCACTHMGLVNEARRYFSAMQKDYGITPKIEHYGCLIDLLARRGVLMEAYNLAKMMPFEPNVVIWGSILNACRVHDNVGLAEKVVDELMKLKLSDEGNFAIISNIYASAAKWDGMAKARLKMRDDLGQKRAGSSWLELDDVVHEFTVGDRMHPQADRILRMVSRLGKHIKQLCEE